MGALPASPHVCTVAQRLHLWLEGDEEGRIATFSGSCSRIPASDHLSPGLPTAAISTPGVRWLSPGRSWFEPNDRMKMTWQMGRSRTREGLSRR